MEESNQQELQDDFEKIEEGLGEALIEDIAMLKMVLADMDPGTMKKFVQKLQEKGVIQSEDVAPPTMIQSSVQVPTLQLFAPAKTKPEFRDILGQQHISGYWKPTVEAILAKFLVDPKATDSSVMG